MLDPQAREAIEQAGLQLDLHLLGGARPARPVGNFRIATKGSRIVTAGGLRIGGDGKITADGQGSLVYLAPDVTLKDTAIQINGANCRVFIGPGVRMKQVILKLSGDDCLVAMGAKTTWESGACICTAGQRVLIGNDCMFSNDVVMRTFDGHGIWETASGKNLNPPGDVTISHHVWLGNGSPHQQGDADRAGVGGRPAVDRFGQPRRQLHLCRCARQEAQGGDPLVPLMA